MSYTTETIKGVVYAIFPAAAGSYQADYAPDTTAPVHQRHRRGGDLDGRHRDLDDERVSRPRW